VPIDIRAAFIYKGNMNPIPAQPNLLQYPISDLYLFPVYATRAVYQTATGQQAPAFNSAQPIKQWFDPSPNGQPYLIFDTTAGQLITLPLAASVASTVNLPGSYNYPAYVETPTDATVNCAGGYVAPTPILPATLCLKSEAIAIAAAIAPLFPGKTVTVADGSAVGVFFSAYPTDEPRRQWSILVNGVSPSGAGLNLYAKTLMLQSYSAGVGAPGHYVYQPAPGEPANDPTFAWIQDPQVTTAPAGAMTLPVPIRQLLPNEEFVLMPPHDPAFGSLGSQWMVARTDVATAAAQALATLQSELVAYNETPGVTQQLALTPVVMEGLGA